MATVSRKKKAAAGQKKAVSDQKRQANRANARKSTGPADTGRTKYNAVRHGLCAASLTLPGEDPEVARQLVDDWDSYYRPRGPAERHLADECIRASLLAGRAHDASMTALTRQVREADEDWLRHDEEKVAHLRTMLEDDPAAALREMRKAPRDAAG